MFKKRKFYIFSVLFLAASILFSACQTVKNPETTEGEKIETTAPAVTLTTAETPVIYETVGLMPPPEYEGSDTELCVTMTQFHWSGYGTAAKSIESNAYVMQLTSLLQDAPETGVTLPALSDSNEQVTTESGILPAKPGTLWIETQNGLYRLTDDYTSLCRVDHHLGEGIELAMSAELRTLILNLWSYYPFDYYSGTYKDGRLLIGHRFAAESDVRLIVKDMHISRSIEEKSTITAELISDIDQTLRISLDCQQSIDNLGLGESKTMELKAGKAEILTLSFEGWTNFGYEILLKADNTRIRILIEP